MKLPSNYQPGFRVPGRKPINGVLDPNWKYAKNIAMLALPEGRAVRDLATNELHTPTSTAFEPVYDAQHGSGIGTPNDDTSEIILGEQYGSGGSLEKWSKPTSEVTLVCVCRRVGTAAGNAPIFGATTATNSPYTPWNFIDRTGNGTLQFESAIGGIYRALELPNALSDNKMHVLVGTYDGTNTRLFVDGVERLNDIRSGALTYPAQCRPVIGNFWDYDAQPRSFNGYVHLGLVLDKAMPREEVGRFSRELYTQFLKPANPLRIPIQVSGGGGPTPVTADLTAQWNLLQAVQSDANLQWSLLNAVQQSADLQWSILNSVQQDADLQWSIIQAVQQDADLQWNILAALSSVQSDLTAQWNILQGVFADSESRWSILNSVFSDSEARWSILNSVLSDADLRWNVLSALSSVSNDLELRWDMSGKVFSSLTAQWNIFNSVTSDADLKWSILNAISQDLSTRWDVVEAVQAGADLRWDIIAATDSTLTLRWNIASETQFPDLEGVITLESKTPVFTVSSLTPKITVH